MNQHQHCDPRARLNRILWQSDMEMTRLALAAGAILWAAFLWWPGELFGPSRKTYEIMAEIASENLWAAAFAVQGVVMLYGLLCACRSKILFHVDAVFGCVLWTAATAACFLAHFTSWSTYQPPAAMAYELVGAVLSWWCLVRYTKDNTK